MKKLGKFIGQTIANIMQVITVSCVALNSGLASNFNWMDVNIGSLGSILPSCIEVPQISGLNQNSVLLSAETNNDVWVSTGVRVEQGKTLAMAWDTNNITKRPDRYRLLYRIDPRFKNAQVFIQKYDYLQQKYVSDFHSFKDGQLRLYQQYPSSYSNQRLDDYKQYFDFGAGRQSIMVQSGNVINITLDSDGKFYSANSDPQMQAPLTGNKNPLTIFTESSGLNNKILHTTAAKWCRDIITISDADYYRLCATYPSKYLNSATELDALLGMPSETQFASKIISTPSCAAGRSPASSDDATAAVCFYDKGRGFKVAVAGNVIKNSTDQMVYSAYLGKYFIYHQAQSDGELVITNEWPIEGMFANVDQTMEAWKTRNFSDIDALNTYLNNLFPISGLNFLHFGNYALEIEIGSGAQEIVASELELINLEYFISESDAPNTSSTTYIAGKNFRTNAYASGYLWLKLTGAADKSGTVNVKLANYTGSTWFSSVVYGELVEPLKSTYNSLTQDMYQRLVTNNYLGNIARTSLTLYIIIYGLMFLAGAVQITISDIVARVVKIGIVIAMFSPTSWNFFNNNLFVIFTQGSEYLLTNVIGATSNTGNIFGFIDPIFDRYTNGNIWALLFIQLFQLHNGLAFFALLTIYSLLTYLRSVLEIIVNYCLAFLGVAVMISLAPFFIILILFERTRSMFEAWLSTLFSYMIQPTVLLVFFLLIDQIINQYISGMVTRACWDSDFIPLRISIDLSNIGLPVSFSFGLPFLEGIPFYAPVVEGIGSIDDFFNKNGTFVRIATSCFIFLIFSKLTSGLIEYVTLIVQQLTNVMAARQYGKLQSTSNLPQAVVEDMEDAAKPITSRISRLGNFAKEKFIDQKITYRNRSRYSGEPDYSAIRKNQGSQGGGSQPPQQDGED